MGNWREERKSGSEIGSGRPRRKESIHWSTDSCFRFGERSVKKPNALGETGSLEEEPRLPRGFFFQQLLRVFERIITGDFHRFFFLFFVSASYSSSSSIQLSVEAFY